MGFLCFPSEIILHNTAQYLTHYNFGNPILIKIQDVHPPAKETQWTEHDIGH